MRTPDIVSLLRRLADAYPEELRAVQHGDVERIAFHITTIRDAVGPEASVCDLGGGVGLFSVACAALGMRSILVDDFADAVNVRFGAGPLELHRRHGVEIKSLDLIEQPERLGVFRVDAITCFDAMEHWHHSPKRLFNRCVDQHLNEDGVLFLGVPNCVNLRKRLTALFGRGKWSAMEDWYERERFRGHVREPDVDDLAYIARDLGLREVKVFGRNWLGYHSQLRLVRTTTPIFDRVIRLFPSLCANIYLLARHGEA